VRNADELRDARGEARPREHRDRGRDQHERERRRRAAAGHAEADVIRPCGRRRGRCERRCAAHRRGRRRKVHTARSFDGEHGPARFWMGDSRTRLETRPRGESGRACSRRTGNGGCVGDRGLKPDGSRDSHGRRRRGREHRRDGRRRLRRCLRHGCGGRGRRRRGRSRRRRNRHHSRHRGHGGRDRRLADADIRPGRRSAQGNRGAKRDEQAADNPSAKRGGPNPHVLLLAVVALSRPGCFPIREPQTDPFWALRSPRNDNHTSKAQSGSGQAANAVGGYARSWVTARTEKEQRRARVRRA